MSRATMSTGSILLSDNKPGKKGNADPSRPCHLIILSDFSARDHRGLNDISSVSNRKIIEVDRDNFDEVFTRLNVQLDIPVAEGLIHFKEIDELHPDFIYEHVPLFNKFRHLKQRLTNNSTFAEAAEEINSWARDSTKSADAPNTSKGENDKELASESVPQDGADLLAQLLGSPASNQAAASTFDVQSLIKDIVAPYVIPGPDPRQDDMLKTVDESVSHLMRKIMHAPAFQQLESAWRGLYLLSKRLETDSKLRIFIADISQQEIIEDCLAAESVERTGLNKLLVENRTATGNDHFSIIVGDYCFDDQLEHVLALHTLGQVAESIDASFVSNGSEKLAGCKSLAKTPDIDDWSYSLDSEFSSQWDGLRNSSAAKHIALSSPKVLLRMPYGKRSSRTESFDFEELPLIDRHPYYLWGNGSWLVGLLLAQHYTEFGWNFQPGQIREVDRLPLHVFTEDDESVVTPCAEILITDSAAGALSDTGLLVIRSIYGKDSIMVPKYRSLSSDESGLQGCWVG